jgi:transcriptional regulator with PAS, ATPase and Fis domain
VRMREIFATLEKVAPSELTVLVTGETGTGKEMIARGIHQASPRKNKPFVVLDCGAIPRDLIESTLFGHEKGSFTGAVAQHQGCFEQAHGGTIFLDEIGELDVNLQPKLLRVLENRELKRVGGDRVIKIDVRVVAATNRDLRQMVNANTFREDLYFRLSVIHVEMPPLRERKEDIPELVAYFLARRRGAGPRPHRMSPSALLRLDAYHWPGNIRELENVLEAEINLCTEDQTVLDQVPEGIRPRSGPVATGEMVSRAMPRTLEQSEKEMLIAALAQNGGSIPDVARQLGISRGTVYNKLRRFAVDPDQYRIKS